MIYISIIYNQIMSSSFWERPTSRHKILPENKIDLSKRMFLLKLLIAYIASSTIKSMMI